MTEQELRNYARYIIDDHIQDIEFLSIQEMAEDYFGEDLSEEDARYVDGLILTADLSINFDD